MRNLLHVLLIGLCAVGARAQMSVGEFKPAYDGVDLAYGTNTSDATIPRTQAVRCFRVDLSNTNVQLFTTPPAPSPDTASLSLSNYLKRYGVSVAINANSYSPSSPNSEGVICAVEGLLVCTGRVVATADSLSLAAMLFTTNKQPTFAMPNYAPGISTTGIFTAVTGLYPILTNGVNLWINQAYSNSLFSIFTPNDNTIHSRQPRTVFGVSQDRRYLYLMTIDGRQGTAEGVNPPYSDGAYDGDSARWMLAFGAWDAINMDGGGSTALYMADCSGEPVAVNHSSYPRTVNPPHERYIAAHLGVYAPALPSFVYNINAVPGSTTATITWNTASNASSRVEYGLTPSYGSTTVEDPTPVTSHTVVINNLSPARKYYFRVISATPSDVFASSCVTTFTTTNTAANVLAYGLTNDWKWATNNYDGVNWKAPGFNDSAWGHGPGTLWVDTRGFVQAGIPSPAAQQLPANPATTYPFITYYFRTHFTYSGNPASALLTFTNYIDDGAIFYLNGVEVNRLYVPSPALNATLATAFYCTVNPGSGNATCPYVFEVSGDLATNLVNGDNVVAVEVHNYAAQSPDLTFGQTLSFPAPVVSVPAITNVVVSVGETNATITWQTVTPASTQVQYGTNSALGSTTPIDPSLATNHSVSLQNLLPLTAYTFRLTSSNGSATATYDGTFATVPFYRPILPITAQWRFTTNDFSAASWMAPGYDDSQWRQGSGLFYVEDNTDVSPRTTPLPAGANGSVFPTYYFRTRFTLAEWQRGFALLLTNFIDDGAVFYLNGEEIKRIRMPVGPISYGTLAADCPADRCDATLDVADLFRVGGDTFTNIIAGENVLAVELHQLTSGDGDAVFGASVGVARASAAQTKLNISFTNQVLQVSWAGSGMTLQHSSDFRQTNTLWIDVVGPVKTSPYILTNPPQASRFYRLRD